MYYFGISWHTQSMIACQISNEHFWEFQFNIVLWDGNAHPELLP